MKLMYSMREIGKKIYRLDNPRELRRYWVFLLRSLAHRKSLRDLVDFFQGNAAYKELFERSPYPIEQVTRAFFYNKSTLEERIALVKNHYNLLYSILQDAYFVSVSDVHWQPYDVWRGEYDGKPWLAQLVFETGQRKEGLLSLELNWNRTHVYQMVFWLGYAEGRSPALWIGAMQGPNMDGAKDIIKKMTKECHGYRTKNLILYMLQAVARAMGIQKIYAVSNYGYYANNHVRSDRKLKTNFGDFWLEAGGWETEDKRFFELPLVEARKTECEIPTRKRAVYRRRFAFLDEVDERIDVSMKAILKLQK